MERRIIPVRLTDAAAAGLDALTTRHRITRTALIEALGQLGRDEDPAWDAVFDLAHRIDRDRRSRR